MRLATTTASAALVVCAVITVMAIRVLTTASTTTSYSAFNSLLTYSSPASTVISRDRAIAAASKQLSKYWTAPMKIDASYGLFSDDPMCTARGNGKCVLVYQKVPAWVVTLTGDDACMPSSGPPRSIPTPTAAQKARCQQNIVIDAKTGKQLLSFN